MNILPNNGFTTRLFVLFLPLLCLANSQLAAEETQTGEPQSIESVFIPWEASDFSKTVVEKNTDYNQYNNILLLPLRYDKLELDTGKDVSLTRNWDDFIEQDMPVIEKRFSKVVEKRFRGESELRLVTQTDEDTLIVLLELLKLEPKAYRDSSLQTVGSETLHAVGLLDYQIVLMDPRGGYIVGLMQDRVHVGLQKKVKNVRSNHYRAWSWTFDFMLRQFKNDFRKLQQQSPLGDPDRKKTQ